MTRWQRLATLFVNMTHADRARIEKRLGDQSINDWLRGLISADLEDTHEAPLQPTSTIAKGERGWGCGARRKKAPAEHGDRRRYEQGCRCVPCTSANTEYNWKRNRAARELNRPDKEFP